MWRDSGKPRVGASRFQVSADSERCAGARWSVAQMLAAAGYERMQLLRTRMPLQTQLLIAQVSGAISA